MSASHTKGPWEASDRGDYDDFDGDSRVVLGDDIRVAVVHDRGTQEAEANARLIAAAPDMLEALEAMEVAYEAENNEAEFFKDYDEDPFLRAHEMERYQNHAKHLARAAIAKAKGEQS